MAYIETTAVSTTSIEVRLSGLDVNYSRDDRFIYWYIDGSFQGSMDVAAGVNRSNIKTFSGLSSNTEYLIEATIFYTNGGVTEFQKFSHIETTEKPKLETPEIYGYLNEIDGDGNRYVQLFTSFITGADTYYLDIFLDGNHIASQTSGASIFYIYGLEPSTTYQVYVQASGDGYEDSSFTMGYITTIVLPELPIPDIIGVTSKSNSLEMDMETVTGADTYYLEAWEGAIKKGSNSSTTSIVEISGLFPNRYYELRRWVEGNGYKDSDIGYSTANTGDLGTLETPTITSLISSTTTIVIGINGVPNASEYYYRLELMDGSFVDSKITSALEVEFTGLTLDTQYKIEINARNTNYINSDYVVDYIYTKPEALSAPTNFSLSDVLEGGATFTWDAVADADNYTLRAERLYDGNISYITSSSTSITFTSGSLQYGVNYGFSVKAIRNEGAAYDSPWTSAINQITRPKKPIISIQSSTTNSITVEVTGMVDNYDGAWVNIYADGETNANNFLNDIWVSSNGGTATFTNLTTGNSYGFRGITYFTSGSVYKSDYTNILIGSTSFRPLNFAGWSTNVSSGANYSILASDWNTFTSKINEFEVYSGNTQTGFTTVSSGNDFLASYFTAARNAIAAMPYTGTLPSAKSTGDNVNAIDLNNIVDCLNSI